MGRNTRMGRISRRRRSRRCGASRGRAAAASIVASSPGGRAGAGRWRGTRRRRRRTPASSKRSSQRRLAVDRRRPRSRRQHAAEPAEGEVEVARAARRSSTRLGVGERRRRVAGDGPHERPRAEPEREVVDVDLLDRRHRLVDVADLAAAPAPAARTPRRCSCPSSRLRSMTCSASVSACSPSPRCIATPAAACSAMPELAERLAEGDRLLDAALGVGLLAEPGPGPVERAERLHHAVAVVQLAEPGERPLGELLGLGQPAGPQPQVGEQRLHHQRRPACCPAGGASPSTDDGQRLGLVEAALEVRHPRLQALRPAHAAGVAELVEALLGLDQLHLGVGEVARLERHPRQVLVRPGVAALVVDLVVDLHRLVEEARGRRRASRRTPRRSPGPAACRRAGGRRRARGTARSPASSSRAGRRRGRPASAAIVTETPPGLGLVDAVAVGQRRARAPRWASAIAAAKLRRSSSASARTSSSSRSVAGSARCRSRAAAGVAGRRLAGGRCRQRRRRRLQQRRDGVAADRRLDAVDRCRARRAARRPSRRGGRRRRSAPRARPSRRRRRRGAAPAPAWSVSGRRPRARRRCGTATSWPSTSSSPSAASSSRSPRRNSWPISLAKRSSEPMASPVPSTAALSMIARCGAGSWSRRAAISARSEPGSSEPRAARRRQPGQLDEEQRVAAAAGDELGDRPIARRRPARCARGCRGPASSTSSDAQRAERHLQHERALDRRRPHDVGVGSLARDEQERQVGRACAR